MAWPIATKSFWWSGCLSWGCKTSLWQWLEAEGEFLPSRREPAFHKEIISYDSVMNLCACISSAAGARPSYVSVCHRPSAAQSKQRIPFSLRGGEPSWHEASLGHGSFPKLGVLAEQCSGKRP